MAPLESKLITVSAFFRLAVQVWTTRFVGQERLAHHGVFVSIDCQLEPLATCVRRRVFASRTAGRSFIAECLRCTYLPPCAVRHCELAQGHPVAVPLIDSRTCT